MTMVYTSPCFGANGHTVMGSADLAVTAFTAMEQIVESRAGLNNGTAIIGDVAVEQSVDDQTEDKTYISLTQSAKGLTQFNVSVTRKNVSECVPELLAAVDAARGVINARGLYSVELAVDPAVRRAAQQAAVQAAAQQAARQDAQRPAVSQ